jgi:hypothetical protein
VAHCQHSFLFSSSIGALDITRRVQPIARLYPLLPDRGEPPMGTPIAGPGPALLAIALRGKRYYSIKMTIRFKMRNNIAIRLERRSIPEPNTGCWFWLGEVHTDGYGRINIQDKNYRVHRIAYAVHKGPIPRDLNVLHRCDAPLCVNPAHLYLGTKKQNVDDMMARGRAHLVRHRGRFAKALAPDPR